MASTTTRLVTARCCNARLSNISSISKLTSLYNRTTSPFDDNTWLYVPLHPKLVSTDSCSNSRGSFSSHNSPWRLPSIIGRTNSLRSVAASRLSTKVGALQNKSTFEFLKQNYSTTPQTPPPEKTAHDASPSSKIEAPSILSKLNPAKSPERKENIYTLPNLLTASRIAVTPVIGYSILTSQPYLALGLFAYAGISDLIDGWLARNYNSGTVLGSILDPFADKALVTTVVVCTTLQGLLPVWLAVIILGRDVALAISAIYFRYISLPPPKTFTRYWDFSLPSAEVRPTEISKINTLLQLLLIGNAMVLPVLPETLVNAYNLVGVFEGWQYLVASTTIWSGLSYVFNKDAVKILSEEEIKAKEAEQRSKQS